MGAGLPIAVSLVAIVMGLNLLNALPLQLPSLDVDVRGLAAPPLLQVGPRRAARPLPHRARRTPVQRMLGVGSTGSPGCEALFVPV